MTIAMLPSRTRTSFITPKLKHIYGVEAYDFMSHCVKSEKNLARGEFDLSL